MKFGLTQTQFEILDRTAIQPLKKAGGQVWIFGSRARGDHKTFSDIDLLFSFPEKAPAGLLGLISEALEESRLPFKVDLVNESELADSYREGVLDERQAL